MVLMPNSVLVSMLLMISQCMSCLMESKGELLLIFSPISAQFFAQSSASANQNRGNTRDGANVPVICAVTANSQNNWRTGIRKVWIPVGDIAQSVNGRNDPTKLARQQARIQAVHDTTTNTVRFSVRK